MPIYEYRCANGHVFDVIQAMSDDPVQSCEECGAPVERIFHPVAVHFKGSGFYSTDYKGESKAAAEAGKDGASGDSSGKGKSEAKGDSGAAGKGSESKADPKDSSD